MKLQTSQIIPSSNEIKDPATKKFADKLKFFLDGIFRQIASIPFNQSESIDNSNTGTANVEFALTHHLERVPAGYILTKSDKSCNIYTGTTAWTNKLTYLKCDVANVSISVTIF